MVGSILNAADCFRLISLIGVVEFFDTFAGSIGDLREALSIPRLTGAVRAYLSGIAS